MLKLLLGFNALACAILANKMVLKFLPPTLFVALRTGIPGLLFFIIEWPKISSTFKHHQWRFWLKLLFITLCTTLLPLLFKSYALQNMPAAKAALLASSDPFIASFYAYIFWSEPLNLRKFIAMLFVIIGTSVLLCSKTPLEEALMSFGVFSYPELSALAALIIGKLGWVLVCQMLRTEQITSRQINAITLLGTGILATPMAWYWQEASSLQTLIDQPKALIALLSTMVLHTTGIWIYTSALKRISFTVTSIAGCIIPVLVSLGGYLFYGEAITLHWVIALICIFVAIKLFHQQED